MIKIDRIIYNDFIVCSNEKRITSLVDIEGKAIIIIGSDSPQTILIFLSNVIVIRIRDSYLIFDKNTHKRLNNESDINIG